MSDSKSTVAISSSKDTKSDPISSSKDIKCDSSTCQDKDCEKDHSHEHIINGKIEICTEQGCSPCIRCTGYNNSGTSWCRDCENDDDDNPRCNNGSLGCNGSSCSECY